MNTKTKDAPRDIALLFTDFDGSCGVHGSIPDENAAAIARFLEGNPKRHAVIASARPHYSLREKIAQTILRNYSKQISISAFSGALSFFGEEVLNDNPLDRNLVRATGAAAQEICLGTFFFASKNIYSPSDKRIIDLYNQSFRYGIVSDPMPSSEETYLLELWKSKAADEKPFLALGSDPTGRTKTYNFRPLISNIPELDLLMHIMPAGIGKEHALGAYLKRMDLRPEQAMVIGDEANDIQALSTPGVLAVTFADATAAARSIPGIYVAPPARECGFAKAVNSLVT
ncbi:MAG: HAD hydrolase family protein [archaeon]